MVLLRFCLSISGIGRKRGKTTLSALMTRPGQDSMRTMQDSSSDPTQAHDTTRTEGTKVIGTRSV